MFKVERSTRTRKARRNVSHRIAANKEVILKTNYMIAVEVRVYVYGRSMNRRYSNTYELKYAVILKKEEEEQSSF
jgi:hypothetical protein